MTPATKLIIFTLNIMTNQLTWDPVTHVIVLIKLNTVTSLLVVDANQI